MRVSFAAQSFFAEGRGAAIDLIQQTLRLDDVAGRFVGAGQQVAEHDRVGARRQRLDDVAGVLDAAVADDRDAVAVGFVDVRNGLQGGHAVARHDTRGAQAAAADGGFEGHRAVVFVRDPLDEHAGGFGGGDLADDDRVVLIRSEVLGEQLDHAAVMAVGHVETDDGGEPAASLHAVAPIRSHADREADLLAGVVNRFTIFNCPPPNTCGG